MANTPDPALIAISRYVGYSWRDAAQMTDLDGVPLDISAWTIVAQLSVPGSRARRPSLSLTT